MIPRLYLLWYVLALTQALFRKRLDPSDFFYCSMEEKSRFIIFVVHVDFLHQSIVIRLLPVCNRLVLRVIYGDKLLILDPCNARHVLYIHSTTVNSTILVAFYKIDIKNPACRWTPSPRSRLHLP